MAVRLTGALTEKSTTGSVHGGKVTWLAIVGDALVSVGFDDTMRFTRLGSTNMDADSVAMNGQPSSLSSLAGSDLFAVSTTNEVALFVGRARVGGVALPGDKFTCNVVALASAGELAMGCSDFKTRVYGVSADYQLTCTATLETRSAVTALSYRPSADFLAVGDNGRQVEVFECGAWTERVKGAWAFHTSRVNCLCWSPNGAYVASGSVDECVIIWDFATPSKRLILPFAHSTGVSSLAWLDDQRLASVGYDGTIVMWKIPASL